ncbi:MAG: hypothetical protein P8O81_02115 [Flavobacteriaceae bacterium]|nr:hypothetical protein [Flavobacteriaceae bacterium]MDG1974721.1 hypothetical protein [Flavobacteriaceae bacterium]|tara:strand:+ start:1093 stop:1626 length:534 start_codon:yes stop_codon:yes gene_type:complete
MKKIFLLILIVTLTSCTNTGVTVTFDDEKSNAIRTHYENYLNNDMDGLKSLWASDLEVFLNSTEAISTDELVVLLQAQHATFDPITMSWGQNEQEDIGQWVETTTYPAGPANDAVTVTQTWFNWNATSKLTGETINLPAHISFLWNEDGKIAQEFHNYDTGEMTAAIEAAQAASASE